MAARCCVSWVTEDSGWDAQKSMRTAMEPIWLLGWGRISSVEVLILTALNLAPNELVTIMFGLRLGKQRVKWSLSLNRRSYLRILYTPWSREQHANRRIPENPHVYFNFQWATLFSLNERVGHGRKARLFQSTFKQSRWRQQSLSNDDRNPKDYAQ